MNLPSVFDVETGHTIAPEYAVPGTPVTVKVHPHVPGLYVFVNGVRQRELEAELMQEFGTVRRSAESLHQIGHRLRARFL